MTSCDEPYIGDESIIAPPASRQLRTTSAQASLATGSSPTLNVIQLPRPMAGTCSPVDGIGRLRIAVACERAGDPGIAAQALAAASTPRARRRVHCDGRLPFMRQKQQESSRHGSLAYEHRDIPLLGSILRRFRVSAFADHLLRMLVD